MGREAGALRKGGTELIFSPLTHELIDSDLENENGSLALNQNWAPGLYLLFRTGDF
jgi:hypothetical protein